MYKYFKRMLWVFLLVLIMGYFIPNNTISPIAINDIARIDPESFWFYPWGASGVHKGIDIFCEKGSIILSPVAGIVIKKGFGTISGNYIYILGPKWRTYYFAHMDTMFVNKFTYLSKGDKIGKVGNTGNAANKPAHLHYAIETIFPYFWLYDSKAVMGWKKMFYLDPMKQLNF